MNQQVPQPSPEDQRLGPPRSVLRRLFTEGYCFDFFQAVRVLEKVERKRRPLGFSGPPWQEVVRLRAHLSFSFPASSIYEVLPASDAFPVPIMRVAFMGLTGPSGVLPLHYTDLLLRLQREAKGDERSALRAWLDLFNHRMISHFYRAWTKYQLPLNYERGEAIWPTVLLESYRPQPDPITLALFSFIGMGIPPLRQRLRVVVPAQPPRPRQVLVRIEDLALLRYAGLLSQRPRSAVALQALLCDFFGLQIQVKQFTGQWLRLDEPNQTRLGHEDNAQLGISVVAGDRVWDVQGKFRLRVGPLTWAQFTELLPDRTPVPERKSFFLLVQLTRLYIGPDMDFDVQLVLRARDVPGCLMSDQYSPGLRLGWNSWVLSKRATRDASDAIFEGEEVYTL